MPATNTISRICKDRRLRTRANVVDTVLEAVMEDDGSLPGPGCAVRRQPVIQAQDRRDLGDLGFAGEQDFPDQFQLGVPAFGFVSLCALIVLGVRVCCDSH